MQSRTHLRNRQVEMGEVTGDANSAVYLKLKSYNCVPYLITRGSIYSTIRSEDLRVSEKEGLKRTKDLSCLFQLRLF